MSITDVLKTVGASTTGSASVKKTQSLGQDEFLKLMTTQMTHQDPTKPMDNAQFLSQMAQFGTVSGIQDLQKSFKDFSTSISSDQALQAASLVGRTVSISTNEAPLTLAGKVNGSFNLPENSSSVIVKIIDPTNDDKVIATQRLGEKPAGSVDFEWDGYKDNKNPAPPGVYKVQVEATLNGVNTILQPNIRARVDSVSMANDSHGLQVNLNGFGLVNFNKITQINKES
jgi:flagellar basal-body rod modification protein FlgD